MRTDSIGPHIRRSLRRARLIANANSPTQRGWHKIRLPWQQVTRDICDDVIIIEFIPPMTVLGLDVGQQMLAEVF